MTSISSTWKWLIGKSNFIYSKGAAVVFATLVVGLFIYYKLKQTQKQGIYFQEKKKILLIGLAGVGKTMLFRILKGTYQKIYQQQQSLKEIEERKKFQDCELSPNVDVVDTPSIDLDDNIDTREQCIASFQQYFLKNQNQIINFFIVVNFERTDLMKKKISSVMKYFQRNFWAIGLIVTDFDKSESPEYDQKQLLIEFQLYRIRQESILFILNTIDLEDLKQKLLAASNIINFHNTIFEQVDPIEQQQMVQQLGDQLNQRLNRNGYNEIRQNEN